MKHFRAARIAVLLLALLMALGLFSFAIAEASIITVDASQYPVSPNGHYSSMEEVAAYIDAFGRLPDNFITKKEAQALGWDSRAGNLDEVSPGASIGGDHFGNYENNPTLPSGKSWTECDINFDGGYRGGERLVFSKDGLIYYSDDHYTTFHQVKITHPASEAETSKESRPDAGSTASIPQVKKSGEYTGKDEVAAYLHQYGKLPKNYLTKNKAKKLGWSNQKDNLGDVSPGSAIGGDTFGNREGLLPKADGRSWKECDVNTTNGKRGKERIVYSNDGLIYYSPDNHRSFQQLY